MEKTLYIDNKEIKFRSTAATPLRYKAQFGEDFFKSLLRLGSLRDLDSNNLETEKLEDLDLEVFYNIIWVLAKTADKTIPEPLTWFDEFEEFPLGYVMTELKDLILGSINSKKK